MRGNHQNRVGPPQYSTEILQELFGETVLNGEGWGAVGNKKAGKFHYAHSLIARVTL